MKIEVTIIGRGKAKKRIIDISNLAILNISAEWLKEGHVTKITMKVLEDKKVVKIG